MNGFLRTAQAFWLHEQYRNLGRVGCGCGLRECATEMVRMITPVLGDDVKGVPAER